jgi:cell filamentation protein
VTALYLDETDVFKNKLGLVCAKLLRAAEYAFTTVRAKEILSGRVVLDVTRYSLERQLAIHGHLFQDVYGWAGKTRTTSLSKRMTNGMLSIFVEPVAIEPYWELLEQKTAAFVSSKGLSFEQKQASLAKIFIEANAIHPFPEGNGRSLQVFMQLLAREQKIELDYTKVTPQEWNDASAVSGMHGRLFERAYLVPEVPNHDPINKIFAAIAFPAASVI